VTTGLCEFLIFHIQMCTTSEVAASSSWFLLILLHNSTNFILILVSLRNTAEQVTVSLFFYYDLTSFLLFFYFTHCLPINLYVSVTIFDTYDNKLLPSTWNLHLAELRKTNCTIFYEFFNMTLSYELERSNYYLCQGLFSTGLYLPGILH